MGEHEKTQTPPLLGAGGLLQKRLMIHRIGFALEYALGNATHAHAIKQAVAKDASIQPIYVDLNPFAPIRWPANLPVIRSNWQLRSSLEAYLALRKQRLDAAFFHSHSTSLFSIGMMRRVPSVVSLDATRLQLDSFGTYYWANPHPNPRVKAINKRMYLQAYQAARHLVSWSQWGKDSLVADYGVQADKVSVIPPGVDLDLFRPEPSARGADSVVRLLFVGGEFVRKGGDLLMRWAQETCSTHPWELHLVTREDVPAMPNVVVHHGIGANSPELVRLYQQSDVFVMPTRADCLPLVILEALACGLPIVSTQVGAITEMAPDGETGYLVEPEDYASLAERLDALVADASLRRRMGDEARQRAVAHCGLDNYRRLLQMLKEMA
jgi:glycosyltransferase involved in cell wall biosynthesis